MRNPLVLDMLKLMLFGFVLAVFAHASNADELRGIWVDAFGPGFLNRKQVQQLAKDCRENNFNAVFVQMRKRGDAFYIPKGSNRDPRNSALPEDFDPLAEIIKECHSKEPRIQVHCWVVAYFVWAWHKPPGETGHIFNRHPEYLTRDPMGVKMIGKGYYLDPGHPEVGTELLATAKDIVSRYDIDGLHWDYLRYPTQGSGYNETALKRYKEEFAVETQPLPADPRWCDWRKRQVTDFLRWSTSELLELKPSLMISAAVFSDYRDSRDFRFADWVAWNKEGIIDITIPMDFTRDNRFIYEPRARFAATNQWARAVWLGQASYMNSIENTLKQLSFARELDLGTVLYCYRKPAPGTGLTSKNKKDQAPWKKLNSRLSEIRDGFQPQWEPPPTLPWKVSPTKGIIKGTVTTDQGKPVYNATIRVGGNDRELKTEPHGKYAFFELDPGKYHVSASGSGLNNGQKEIRLQAGQIVIVDFQLVGKCE